MLNKLVVELIKYPTPTETLRGGHSDDVWSPTMPEHSGGDQHQNVGLDIFAAASVIGQPVGYEEPGYYAVVRTGIKIKLPDKHHMRIASRSGLAFKNLITAFPGTIDNSYRGEIKVLLYSPKPFHISAGDKVAQGIIFESLDYDIEEGYVDTNTIRGHNGFGSTG